MKLLRCSNLVQVGLSSVYFGTSPFKIAYEPVKRCTRHLSSASRFQVGFKWMFDEARARIQAGVM